MRWRSCDAFGYCLNASTERIFAMARGVESLPVQIGSFVLPRAARLVASVANSSLSHARA